MTLSLLAKKDIQKKYMSIAFSYISFLKKYLFNVCIMCVLHVRAHMHA